MSNSVSTSLGGQAGQIGDIQDLGAVEAGDLHSKHAGEATTWGRAPACSTTPQS
jgi:hypothetical protein